MSFIVQKAFEAQLTFMRGHVLTFGLGLIITATLTLPGTASAREAEQNEPVLRNESKNAQIILRPLTEAVPIRKKEKVRVRRVLM